MAHDGPVRSVGGDALLEAAGRGRGVLLGAVGLLAGLAGGGDRWGDALVTGRQWGVFVVL